MTRDLSSTPPGYAELLSSLQDRIRTARLRAAQAVTGELVSLYWDIGREILARQEAEGWGTKVIDRLAHDLSRVFPGVRGFSPRNLRNMRDLAREFPDDPIWQQLLPKCPWGHLMIVLQKLKDPVRREWYVRAMLEHGWSRAVLDAQIDTRLIDRQGGAPSNFRRTLPVPQSDLAQQIIKDPYHFDFLSLSDDAQERDLERALVDRLTEFLVELGRGFAYVGRQVHVSVGGDDFYVDLLFYHVRLHCYVIFELKMTEFKPEYAGQLNFYIAAVDDLVRDSELDRPTIGVLLCKSKNDVVVEYALRKMGQPIGVSRIELSPTLPDELADQLPTVEQLEAELREVQAGDQDKSE